MISIVLNAETAMLHRGIAVSAVFSLFKDALQIVDNNAFCNCCASHRFRCLTEAQKSVEKKARMEAGFEY